MPVSAPGTVADSITRHRVPRSHAAFSEAQVRDRFAVPDWHPDRHSPMPGIVARGRKPAVIACGFCHLPDGAGRPENATLAGLSVEYITTQIAAIRSRARRSAAPGPFAPSDSMQVAANSATDAEIAEAARYFSAETPGSGHCPRIP